MYMIPLYSKPKYTNDSNHSMKILSEIYDEEKLPDVMLPLKFETINQSQ